MLPAVNLPQERWRLQLCLCPSASVGNTLWTKWPQDGVQDDHARNSRYCNYHEYLNWFQLHGWFSLAQNRGIE